MRQILRLRDHSGPRCCRMQRTRSSAARFVLMLANRWSMRFLLAAAWTERCWRLPPGSVLLGIQLERYETPNSDCAFDDAFRRI
jgi:hypothetical protein